MLFATSRAFNIEKFATVCGHCKDAFAHCHATEERWQAFLNIIQIVVLDIVSGNGVDSLVTQIERPVLTAPIIYYMAIASSLFGPTAMLKTVGLVTPQARLVVKKPLGNSGASSRTINDELTAVFDEHQIYRLTITLAKNSANPMALRFANVIFESLWNNQHIDHVQITVAETVGVTA